jgi:hypothetical protein
MFELSKLVNLPWTPRYCHVDVFLNGSYNGTYILCEHIEEAGNRVNLNPDGFLIERNDLYWREEPVWFTTERTRTYFTFKFPDKDDIQNGDEDYNFIKKFMDDFETTLFSSHFMDPENGYRKYADAESFAKWYLIQEVLGNIEPNPYYVLHSHTAKLQMYPVWDAEWSLGLAAMGPNGWIKAPFVSPVEKYYRKDHYISRMFEDPYFKNIIKAQWQTMYVQLLPQLRAVIKEKTNHLQAAQKNNFQQWTILGQYTSVGLVNFNTWEEEVAYAAGFLEKRIAWLHSEFQKL